MIKVLIFGVLMFILGFVYGRDENLWQKTVSFFQKIVDKIKELVERWKDR